MKTHDCLACLADLTLTRFNSCSPMTPTQNTTRVFFVLVGRANQVNLRIIWGIQWDFCASALVLIMFITPLKKIIMHHHHLKPSTPKKPSTSIKPGPFLVCSPEMRKKKQNWGTRTIIPGPNIKGILQPQKQTKTKIMDPKHSICMPIFTNV